MYYNQNYQIKQLINSIVPMMMMSMGVGMVKPIMLQANTENTNKLEEIHKKWRELDELQIKTHLDCMSARKWAVLNSLDAIGLELTKGDFAINSYIEEKMRTINRALEDLRQSGEINPRY